MADHRLMPRNDADPNAMPLEVAVAYIASSLEPVLGVEPTKLVAIAGRVAAQDVVAELAVPPFRASAMDGYAFRHADVQGVDDVLAIAGTSLAGHPGSDQLDTGCCQRITTGARVPDEADTVVQQEDVTRSPDGLVHINELPPDGENVRDAGSDTPAGTTLLKAGTLVRGADAAVCAAHGIAAIDVKRRVRIGILSTGDELVEPDGQRGSGQIHDANRVLLHSMLTRPCVELIDLGIVADTTEALIECVGKANDLDVLVSSGGVSVGDADHVKEVFGANGKIELWKIAMKPGRPLAFGHLQSGQAWFGLPGNPVSAAITTLMILEPAIARLAGYTYQAPQTHKAQMTSRIEKRPGRIEYQRGLLNTMPDGTLQVSSVGAQDSHRLQSLQHADCLIELPVDSSGADVGDHVTVVRLSDCGAGNL